MYVWMCYRGRTGGRSGEGWLTTTAVEDRRVTPAGAASCAYGHAAALSCVLHTPGQKNRSTQAGRVLSNKWIDRPETTAGSERKNKEIEIDGSKVTYRPPRPPD